jgi:hypothetical protein
MSSTEAARAALLGSAVRDTFGKGAQQSFVLPAIAAIVGIALIAIIVYVIIQTRQAGPKAQTKGPVDLWKPGSVVLVSRNDTAKHMKGTYTLSFYVRFDAVPDMRAETPFLMWPGNWTMNYNPAQESLQWLIRPAPDGSYGSTAQTIPIRPVPLQRWTQVALVVEGRSLDMYVNGQLVKSDQLTNLPTGGPGSITVAPGQSMGQLAYVQMWGRRLSGAELAANYADTSDSQGRPLIGPDLFGPFKSIPNLFCPSGDCSGTKPSAQPSQTWEFPYA